MEVRLSEITRRLLISYYPIWLAASGLRYYRVKLIYHLPLESFFTMFIFGQLSIILAFCFIILSLWIFNPEKIHSRLLIMIISASFVIAIDHLSKTMHFDLDITPFLGPSVVTSIFFSALANGTFAIWFFFIAERSLISEKRYMAERTERLYHDKMLVENRLKLLQAQIEPQFLFDTLTNILRLRDIDLEKAKLMQVYFIKYLRSTLVKTRRKSSTIEQEMELINAYLGILKSGMENRLEYSIDMDPEIAQMPFPSMLIQPIIENALKHGIKKMEEGGAINIKAFKENNLLKIEIADTGPGEFRENFAETGLSSVKTRLDSLFDGKARLYFLKNEPTGLKVIFEVPCD
jgi:sensor histidine kinase YesM